MRKDNDTKEKLLISAKEEFMEKGFRDASLRTICSKAGVTTGAVYCFFGDKDGLLAGLVDDVYQGVKLSIDHHLTEMTGLSFSHSPGDHDSFVEELVHVLYQDHDAVVLVMSKSEGSKYEHVVEDIISLVESKMTNLVKTYSDSVPGKRVNRYMVHWLSHLSVMSFVHLLTHIDDEKEALKFMKPAMDHLITGWTNYLFEDVAG